MATNYQKQATKQLNPLYNQQIKSYQAQIPAIQKLYQTLSSGLETGAQNRISTGVREISEDASARGVLRSTIPVDAGTQLRSEVGAALAQGLAQYGAQQAQDLAGIRSNINQARLERTQNINSLANTLQSNDMQKRQYELEKRKIALAERELASGGGSSGRSISASQQKANNEASLRQDIIGFFGTNKAKTRGFTENTVLPQLIAAYPELDPQTIIDNVYRTRKAIGLG